MPLGAVRSEIAVWTITALRTIPEEARRERDSPLANDENPAKLHHSKKIKNKKSHNSRYLLASASVMTL
jgi:hypothetical protein